MPTLYEYFGLFFFFYSKDHTPIHLHVSYAEFENKLEFVYVKGKLVDVKVKHIKGTKSLPANKLKEAIKLVTRYEKDITVKWTEYFGKNKPPVKIKITKKL